MVKKVETLRLAAISAHVATSCHHSDTLNGHHSGQPIAAVQCPAAHANKRLVDILKEHMLIKR